MRRLRQIKIELVPLLEDLKKSLDLDIEVDEFKKFFKFKKAIYSW